MSSPDNITYPSAPTKFEPGCAPVNAAPALSTRSTCPCAAIAPTISAPPDAESAATESIAAVVVKFTKEQMREADLFTKMQKAEVKLSDKVTEPETTIALAGKPVATPGNITTIVAKSKAGKSTAVGGAIGGAIATSLGRGDQFDTLGFTTCHPAGRALIVFDTEQDRYDAWENVRRACSRVGVEEQPAWLRTFCLADTPMVERRALVAFIMERCSADHEGIFAVIVDGVTDLVASVNDEETATVLVEEIAALARKHACPMICIIHSNEGKSAGDDARGWLGKQLIRKAQSNLILEKDSDGVTTITSQRQRKAPITKADGVAFRWSDTLGRHESCGSPAVAKKAALDEGLRDLAVRAFGIQQVMSRAELEKAIARETGMSGKTAFRRADSMVSAGVITKGVTGYYSRPLGK